MLTVKVFIEEIMVSVSAYWLAFFMNTETFLKRSIVCKSSDHVWESVMFI